MRRIAADIYIDMAIIITAKSAIIPKMRIITPYAIMLIIINRKTDTAAAMPVITTLFNQFAQLSAEFDEGALQSASFDVRLLLK